jgi:hypothetical protein
MDAASPAIGSEIYFGASDLHFFDPETGVRR